MGSLMPGFRRAIDKDLRARGVRREHVEAAALRLLDRGVFRVGNEEYVEENGSCGLATLLREHVQFSKKTIAFDFPAKSGIRRTLVITDARLNGHYALCSKMLINRGGCLSTARGLTRAHYCRRHQRPFQIAGGRALLGERLADVECDGSGRCCFCRPRYPRIRT